MERRKGGICRACIKKKVTYWAMFFRVSSRFGRLGAEVAGYALEEVLHETTVRGLFEKSQPCAAG